MQINFYQIKSIMQIWVKFIIFIDFFTSAIFSSGIFLFKNTNQTMLKHLHINQVVIYFLFWRAKFCFRNFLCRLSNFRKGIQVCIYIYFFTES